MEALIILALIILLVLVILPYWLGAPKKSRDKRLVQGVLPPGSRRYSLMLPEESAAGRKVPLVVALHFGGHGLPFYGEIFLTDLIEPAFRSLGAIIVAPDCPVKDWTQPASEDWVIDLMDYLIAHYPVDSARVALVGFSMGGIGAWHLLNRFPERFSAAVIMAARPPEGSEELTWKGPMYILHGREDELFPVMDTTRVLVRLEERGYDLTYRILEGVTHHQTFRFQTPLEMVVPWLRKRWGDGD